ncbi:hypothetical protein BAE44_0015434 [Dichanthelium oligosanthes]|uniref:Rubredoxin-like domain-containing protein n=1 Tax=Dichanthelium oligosanthes TaxID=888268 RepID=A0A1E5VEJ0_9POAL|nr:hypothetical protein BAE44_0015434 [Dichanthelium oligosanthes]
MDATRLPHCQLLQNCSIDPQSSPAAASGSTTSTSQAHLAARTKRRKGGKASELPPIASRSLLSPPAIALLRRFLHESTGSAAMALLQAPASSLARAPRLRPSFSAPWSVVPARRRVARVATAARITMRVASKQAYICRDCGYIYSDRTPFDKLSDNYFCPVCGAPKRRFRPYEPAVSKNANATDARKARKEQLKKDEAVGQALPIAIVVGIIALAGLYFYLNSAYN